MTNSSWPRPSWRHAVPPVVVAALLLLGLQLRSSPPEAEPQPEVKTQVKRRAVTAQRKVAIRSATRVQAAAAAITLPQMSSDPGPVRVQCEVGRSLEGRSYVVTVEDPEAPHGTGLRQGTYDGHALELVLPPDSTRGMLIFPGTEEESVPLSFAGGTCALEGELPGPADAALYGVVRGAQGLPDGTVYLEGCGAAETPVDVDGNFFVSTEPGPCLMRAWRRAGSLRVPGRWYEVEPLAGGDVQVELSVPDYAPAGMGITFNALEDGVVVTGLQEGRPAMAAGLREGDQITKIDGVPTERLGADGFLQQALGPEGSPVRLEGVTADGEPFEVTLSRAAF
jgi:hypothetical protein